MICKPYEEPPQTNDRRRNAGDAAEALALGIVFRRASGIEAVDRFDPAVQIVDVDDVQREIGLRDPGCQRQRGSRGEKTGH